MLLTCICAVCSHVGTAQQLERLGAPPLIACDLTLPTLAPARCRSWTWRTPRAAPGCRALRPWCCARHWGEGGQLLRCAAMLRCQPHLLVSRGATQLTLLRIAGGHPHLCGLYLGLAVCFDGCRCYTLCSAHQCAVRCPTEWTPPALSAPTPRSSSLQTRRQVGLVSLLCCASALSASGLPVAGIVLEAAGRSLPGRMIGCCHHCPMTWLRLPHFAASHPIVVPRQACERTSRPRMAFCTPCPPPSASWTRCAAAHALNHALWLMLCMPSCVLGLEGLGGTSALCPCCRQPTMRHRLHGVYSPC